jgi:hypothetical protein
MTADCRTTSLGARGAPESAHRRLGTPRAHYLPKMRVYEGSARRNYEEVLRSIGAILDSSMLRELLLLEVEDGFFVQGLGLQESSRPRTIGGAISLVQELTYFDDDLARLLEDGARRRGSGHHAGPLEAVMRVLGRYVDGIEGGGLLLVENAGGFLMRLTSGNQNVTPYSVISFPSEMLSGWLTGAQRDRRR